MNKSELIAILAQQKLDIPEKEIVLIVNQIIESLSNAFIEGKRIEIRGFGSFALHYRPPRRARNPKTGKTITTEGKYIPHFKASKELRTLVDETRLKGIEIEGDKD